MSRHAFVLVFALACGGDAGGIDAPSSGWQTRAALPEAIANNAVAAVADGERCLIYSVSGIDASRAATGVHRRAYALEDDAWRALPEPPGIGRIAASAVALRGRVYVLGGYSIAATGAETTHAEVDVFDPAVNTWSTAAALATPIDDAVAVAWQDRWIVVVSGWSSTRPVAAVQIYDADADAWTAGTAFPGTPVFGHAGAITGNDLIVLDGVGSSAGGFALVNQAWHAILDPAAPTTLRWEPLVHPGPARYRAAAGTVGALLIWAGGTSAPYNYDGLSYATGAPSSPLSETLTFDLAAGFGTTHEAPQATMDHRAMVGCGASLTIVGGMTAGPVVSTSVSTLHP